MTEVVHTGLDQRRRLCFVEWFEVAVECGVTAPCFHKFVRAYP